MTTSEWLSRCTPRPPEALSRRIDELLGADREAPAQPNILVSAAERTLAGLLARHATSRDAALDLLAADALVTYAFELAADEPESLDDLATSAMRRLSSAAPAP
ncbi:MAG: hypothetical protein U0163_02770 [Gemmatimonadaceae bacterium]